MGKYDDTTRSRASGNGHDYATKQDMEDIVNKSVGKAVDDLSEIVRDFVQHVDDRFNKLEVRADRMDHNFERLQNTLDHFLKRLDDVETDNAARDAQLARLERWIEQIAAKTGVTLVH